MGQYFSQHAEDASKCLIFCHFRDRSEQRRGTQNKDQLPVHWFPKICQEKPATSVHYISKAKPCNCVYKYTGSI